MEIANNGSPIRPRQPRRLYGPLSIATSAVGAITAAEVFKRLWKRFDQTEPAPLDAKALNKPAQSVLFAAALQGLTFGFIRALVDRIGARGYQALTHAESAPTKESTPILPNTFTQP